MTSNLKRALGFCGWATAVLGILKSEPLLKRMIEERHSICGPWGCGPPLTTILVWNGFIASILIPTAILLGVKRWGAGGKVLTLIALACVGWVTYDVASWNQGRAILDGSHLVQRALFSTVAFPDAPVVPSLISGLVYWWTSHVSVRDAE